MSTTATSTPSINIVTKSPPPCDGSHLRPRQKDALTLMIEGLAVGQCLEYRGPIKRLSIAQRTHRAAKHTKKAYTFRTVEGGADIYCTGVKA